MSNTEPLSRLTQIRLSAYASGLFPTCPFSSTPKGKALVFKLAMGRTLKINLISRRWCEESPEGEFIGTISPDGAKRISKRAQSFLARAA